MPEGRDSEEYVLTGLLSCLDHARVQLKYLAELRGPTDLEVATAEADIDRMRARFRNIHARRCCAIVAEG